MRRNVKCILHNSKFLVCYTVVYLPVKAKDLYETYKVFLFCFTENLVYLVFVNIYMFENVLHKRLINIKESLADSRKK